MRIITIFLLTFFLTACVEHEYYSSQTQTNAYSSSGSVPSYTTGYNRDFQPPKKPKAPRNYYSRQSFQRTNDYYSSQPPTSMGYSSSGSQSNS